MPVGIQVKDTVNDMHLCLCTGGCHIENAHFLLQLFLIFFMLHSDSRYRCTDKALRQLHCLHCKSQLGITDTEILKFNRCLLIGGPEEYNGELQSLGLVDTHNTYHIRLAANRNRFCCLSILNLFNL